MPDLDSPLDALDYGAGLLLGDRVRLRVTTEEDLPTLARWWTDSGWAVLQQQTVKPRPVEAVMEMFRSWGRNDSASGAGFSIVTREEQGGPEQLLGHATIWGAMLPARIGTYAMILGPDHIGQGYGTDATHVMLGYAFREMGLHKVELQTWAFNTRGIRAYAKAGFVEEGRRRAVVFHDGVFHDEVLMGILAEEWQQHSR